MGDCAGPVLRVNAKIVVEPFRDHRGIPKEGIVPIFYSMSFRQLFIIIAFAIGLVVGSDRVAFGQCSYDLNGVGYPPSCGYRGRTTNTDSGPSPEVLKKQREAKDTQEAADDAEQNGEEFYAKGDWANAVKAFQEALDYNPDDAVASANLQKARTHLQEAQAKLQSEAARQAVNAQTRSVNALGMGNEAGSVQARKPWDDPDNTKNGGITVPPANGDGGHKDPIVPTSRRTAAITKLEQQRETDRKRRATLEEKLKTLDPQKDSVVISTIKQQESKLDNDINYVNFSIDEQLRTPSNIPPGKAK